MTRETSAFCLGSPPHFEQLKLNVYINIGMFMTPFLCNRYGTHFSMDTMFVCYCSHRSALRLYRVFFVPVVWCFPKTKLTLYPNLGLIYGMSFALFFFVWSIVYFGPFWLYWQSSLRCDRKQDESEGEWHAAKGPRPGLKPWGRCSEDKPSVHGTPALPTELNGTPIRFFFLTWSV